MIVLLVFFKCWAIQSYDLKRNFYFFKMLLGTGSCKVASDQFKLVSRRGDLSLIDCGFGVTFGTAGECRRIEDV